MLLTTGIFSTKEKETNVRKFSLKSSSHKFQMEKLNELIIYYTLKTCVCVYFPAMPVKCPRNS